MTKPAAIEETSSMNLYLINLILCVVWGGVTGSFDPVNLIFGFMIGFGALYLLRRIWPQVGGDREYFQSYGKGWRLGWLFAKELWKSNVAVARMVLAPRLNLRPALVEIPTDLTRDGHLVLLANMITLTPGTMTLDISQDRRRLFVHALDGRDPQGVIDGIKASFEAQIKESLG